MIVIVVGVQCSLMALSPSTKEAFLEPRINPSPEAKDHKTFIVSHNILLFS